MRRTSFLAILSCVVAACGTQVAVTPNPEPRRVAEIFNEGAISRDGRFFSYWNRSDFDGNLFVRDLMTGEDRQLTRQPGEVNESSVISPDSEEIAYR